MRDDKQCKDANSLTVVVDRVHFKGIIEIFYSIFISFEYGGCLSFVWRETWTSASQRNCAE